MKITYALPCSAIFSKMYNKDTTFDSVTWSDWRKVVDGFQSRFIDWYFNPLGDFPKTGNEAYPVLCAVCALIDAFAHYDRDKDWHEPKHYKEFLNTMNSVFRKKLTKKIKTSRCIRGSWINGTLANYADVFYTGVRCSLHHHGDLAPFAGMAATGIIAKEFKDAGKSTCGTRSYPIVVFDPWVIRDELRMWFNKYCDDLRINNSSDRADRFRKRFRSDFGITIPKP